MFIVRRLEKEYRDKEKKLHICFVDLEEAFDRVPKRMIEWALRRKVQEVLLRTVMSLYKGARTRVREGSALSEEFKIWVGVHHGPLFLVIVVNVVTERASCLQKYCMLMIWY